MSLPEGFEWVQVLIYFINNVGFPVFVAVWQMLVAHKDNKKMTELTAEVKAQNVQIGGAIDKLADVLYNMSER